VKIDVPDLTLISYGSLVSVILTLRYPNLYIYCSYKISYCCRHQ